jgi:hypothetical protein
MPLELTPTAARDTALQKVGRNVVNFQKMEAMLKFILVFSNFSTPISRTKEHLAKRARRVRKIPMGVLVTEASKALHDEPPPGPEDPQEIWFSHSFTLGDGHSDPRMWRKAMRDVVKERNKLIHLMLASFNPSSIESCNALCAALDEQRERIIPAYEHLQSIVAAIRETHKELAASADAVVEEILKRRSASGA